MWFADISSHSADHVFLLVIIPFAVQCFFLRQPSLSIFAFCCLRFWCPICKPITETSIKKHFPCMFLCELKGFRSYGWAINAFWVNFCVWGVRQESNSIILHVNIQFSQKCMLKGPRIPRCVFVAPFLKTREPHMHGIQEGAIARSFSGGPNTSRQGNAQMFPHGPWTYVHNWNSLSSVPTPCSPPLQVWPGGIPG